MVYLHGSSWECMKGFIGMLSTIRFRLILPVFVLVGVLIFPASALAHERRTIAGGKYDVLVGWDVEPAFQGQKNAASIRISQAGSNPPVPITGAEKTLSVQIRQGADTRLFPLRSVWGQQGYYVADIVPTRAGDFQWTFVGTVNGDAVNDMFDTADAKFNKVEPITGPQFPVVVGEQSQIASIHFTARHGSRDAFSTSTASGSLLPVFLSHAAS